MEINSYLLMKLKSLPEIQKKKLKLIKLNIYQLILKKKIKLNKIKYLPTDIKKKITKDIRLISSKKKIFQI